METSGASAGLATMAFPGLIEGGLAEEGCRGVNVILFGGFIVSRLFQPRTARGGPPGHHRGRDGRTSTTSSEAKETGLQSEFVPRLLSSLFWAFRTTKA